FGTAKGFNEYSASITGIRRFWLRPLVPLADLPGLDSRPGDRSWTPPSDLDGPGAAGLLAGSELRDRLAVWVGELHREVSRPPAGEEPADG
ncbi:MAG TPA: hypothetical protein VFR03_17460, partial [Thermoanaerobaculia bacterium]|nr:hypothetical protein [Thermoanaerobaculia bacterium]